MPNPRVVNNLATQNSFGELVRKTALAVAEGQEPLDMNALATTNTLADMTTPPDSVILSIVETLDEDGNVTDVEPITNSNELSLPAYGVHPARYEFAEPTIDVRFRINWYLRQADVSTSPTFHKNLSSSCAQSRSKYGGGGGASLNLGFFEVGGGGGGSTEINSGEREAELTVEGHYKYESQVSGLSVNAPAGMDRKIRPQGAPDRATLTMIQQEGNSS